jgi:hypothetical protein
MLDAPAAGLASAALCVAGAHVLCPRRRTATLAGALAGLAASVKWHLALAGAAPVVAALVAPAPLRTRARHLGLVVAAAMLACAVTTPAVLLEPARVASEVRTFAADQKELLTAEARASGRRLGEALRFGLGSGFLVCALAGAAAVLARGPRVLLPVVAVAATWLCFLAASPLSLNRYTLPLAAPAAVLAAHALSSVRPQVVGLGAAALLAAAAVPPLAGYLRLLATDDTRVAAAAWLERSLPAAERVTVLCDAYGGPDLPQPAAAVMAVGLRPAMLGTRLACPERRRVSTGATIVDPDLFRAVHRGAVVVTCEHPTTGFGIGSTPPALVALLEREADLLADFPVEVGSAARRYEPFDRNFAPLVGAATLSRPGPRLRIWRVSGA